MLLCEQQPYLAGLYQPSGRYEPPCGLRDSLCTHKQRCFPSIAAHSRLLGNPTCWLRSGKRGRTPRVMVLLRSNPELYGYLLAGGGSCGSFNSGLAPGSGPGGVPLGRVVWKDLPRAES